VPVEPFLGGNGVAPDLQYIAVERYDSAIIAEPRRFPEENSPSFRPSISVGLFPIEAPVATPGPCARIYTKMSFYTEILSRYTVASEGWQ
jgi:hypothetical protein